MDRGRGCLADHTRRSVPAALRAVTDTVSPQGSPSRWKDAGASGPVSALVPAAVEPHDTPAGDVPAVSRDVSFESAGPAPTSPVLTAGRTLVVELPQHQNGWRWCRPIRKPRKRPNSWGEARKGAEGSAPPRARCASRECFFSSLGLPVPNCGRKMFCCLIPRLELAHTAAVLNGFHTRQKPSGGTGSTVVWGRIAQAEAGASRGSPWPSRTCSFGLLTVHQSAKLKSRGCERQLLGPQGGGTRETWHHLPACSAERTD